MNLTGGSATGIAGAVWTNPSRTLTTFGGGAISDQSVTLTTIPANGAVDLRPAASTLAIGTVAVNAASAGVLSIRLYDGSNAIVLQAVAAGNSGSFNAVGTSFVGLRLINLDPANTAQYMYAGIIFHQQEPMRIVYGKVYTRQGIETGEEWIDTADPATVQMFETWRASGGPSDASGWNEISRHPGYQGCTRYEVLVAEMKRQNDFEGLGKLGI